MAGEWLEDSQSDGDGDDQVEEKPTPDPYPFWGNPVGPFEPDYRACADDVEPEEDPEEDNTRGRPSTRGTPGSVAQPEIEPPDDE
jgi:hypothetical protein